MGRKSHIKEVNERLTIIEKKLDMIEKVIAKSFTANKALAAVAVFNSLMELPNFKQLLDNSFKRSEKDV